MSKVFNMGDLVKSNLPKSPFSRGVVIKILKDQPYRYPVYKDCFVVRWVDGNVSSEYDHTIIRVKM